MNKFLLTWYGITDLRVALGFEEGGGPILGALTTGQYTHLLVLAYTDPRKAAVPETLRAQEEFAATLLNDAGAGAALDRRQQAAVVDAFSNTPNGHDRFTRWLHGEIRRRGLGTAIRVVEKELAFLNDAKGIHDAAAEALDVALATEGEKEVTVYVSPGTPVMAFSWAFVSLVNPDLRVRVIASPDPRNPPEEIRLPYELLVPSSRKRPRVIPGDHGEFDAVFHLFGEQRLPSLLGIQQFPSKRHMFVTSERYPADCMRRFLPDDVEFGERRVNPFDPMSTNIEILDAVSRLPLGARVGFNLTGGTKLMFAGAQAACRKIGGVPFYFETRDHSLVFLDDFKTMEARGVDDVEGFIQIHGFSVSRRGLWGDKPERERRRQLTRSLWERRKDLASIYKDLAGLLQGRAEPRPFEFRKGAVRASLDTNWLGRLQIAQFAVDVEDCPAFAAYLCGGWLEEYTYMQLEPLVRSGLLRDLRIGLEAAWEPTSEDPSPLPAQEFDVLFTDGRRLFVVECKAGNVVSEDIYRLQASIRRYGGAEARGILVAAFPPWAGSRRRLADAKNLSCVSGWNIQTRLAAEVTAMLQGNRRPGPPAPTTNP